MRIHPQIRLVRNWAPALFGVLVVLGVYLGFCVHFHHTAMMAPDESFYTLAARSVYEGKIPYRDFAYTQTPLLPYVNGLFLEIVGFSMDAHRTLNASWGALTLVILMVFLRHRLGRWEPGIVAGFLLAASPRWVSLQTLGVWCGPAGAFMTLAMAAALWRGPPRKRAVVFAIAGTLAIGCRLSCAPVVAVLTPALMLSADGLKGRLKILGICLGVGVFAFLPFLISAPGNFIFHIWSYHMEAAFERNSVAQLMQWWNVSPGVICVTVVGLFGVPRLLSMRKWPELVLIAAAVTGLVTPMIPSSAWGVYIAAGVPVAAAAGAISFWTICDGERTPIRHVAWLLPAMAVFLYLPVEVIEGASTEVKEIAAFIRDEAPDGPLLTPATIIAVEADREVIPGTELGTFSAMLPGDAKRAREVHMTTLVELTEVVERQDAAAIVKMVDPPPWRVWNFRWALPSLDDQPLDVVMRFEDRISECYRPVMRTSTMEVLFAREDFSKGALP